MTPKPLSHYKAIVFDCDGVLLDSNHFKSQGFYEAAKEYGDSQALELKDYAQTHSGVGRQKVFETFFRDTLGRTEFQTDYERAMETYSKYCVDAYARCDETPSLRKVLASIPQPKWVVSGGSQAELRDLFGKRGLDTYFEAIFGNPKTKSENFDIIFGGASYTPDQCLYIGDSRYDHVTSTKYGMDFVFMKDFTAFDEWEEYFRDKEIPVIGNLEVLL